MSFSLGYIQSRSRVGWALSSGGCAVLCEYIFSSASAQLDSVQFSSATACSASASASASASSSSFCLTQLACLSFPYIDWHFILIASSWVDLSSLSLPPRSLSFSLCLSRCLCPCFRVLSPPHPAPPHSLTLNNGCLLCAVFFFFLLFAAASSSSSSATSDSAASVGAALGDLGLREIFVHRHHYHQVAWFVGFERRVPPLCAECAPYLLYLALPRVSISLHLGIFARRRGPMLCFPLFVFNFCFILLCFILFFSSIPSINMSISASVPVFGISSSLLWTIRTVAPYLSLFFFFFHFLPQLLLLTSFIFRGFFVVG